jgi:hypothetical protein
MFIIKKVKPLFNNLVVTCNKYSKDTKLVGTTLVDTTKADTIKEYQTVVSVGPMVRGVEVGDVVFINPKRYAVKKHREGSLKDGVITDNPVIGYNFNIVEIDGIPHMYIQDGDIDFVAEGEEFNENPTLITEKDNKILLN